MAVPDISWSQSIWNVAFDAPPDRVEKLVRRELQTCIVDSIFARAHTLELKVRHPSFSEVISEHMIDNIRFIETYHHSAVLLNWMSLPRNQDYLVLHVDSHRDLARPNLLMDTNNLIVDRWTGDLVSPNDISSLKQAVDSSAIEIGSFLTAAILFIPICGVVWFHPPSDKSSARAGSRMQGLQLNWSNCDPLDSSVRRLNATFGHSSKDVSLVETSQPDSARLNSKTDPMIILDIDLDYFDNTNQHNADEFTIATFDERIDLFLGLLRTIDLSRLALISIARSPGFCPERMASIISAELQKGFSRWIRERRWPGE